MLGAIVIAGSILRLWRLGSQPLNFDESFTAMVGRLPLGTLFTFLRAHDSHPPLDYLVQLPLARVGASPFWFRLPSVLCSIGALGLFAWWMRDRGRVGMLATAAMAVSAFQLTYAREARMYAVMELVGVATAVVAESWLRSPRRRHAVVIGVLVFLGLLTHVSMFLAAIGLLALAGARGDRDAWRWRTGILVAAAGWALLWGPAFLTQAAGGHSSWIPRTTPLRLADTISGLVTSQHGLSAVVFAAIVAGVVVCRRRDATLATVLMCCFVVPVALAALLGLRAPVLLDRTLTVVAWAPLLALAYAVDAVARRARAVGPIAIAVAMLALLPSAAQTVNARSGPTAALNELERVDRPGDIIAVQPASKGVELDWTFGVRGDDGKAQTVQLAGFSQTSALALTGRRPSGRVWIMQYRSQRLGLRHLRRCARTWHHGPTRLICIERASLPHLIPSTAPSILSIYDARPPARPGPRRR